MTNLPPTLSPAPMPPMCSQQPSEPNNDATQRLARAQALALVWHNPDVSLGYRYGHSVRARVSVLPTALRRLLHAQGQLDLPAAGLHIRRGYGNSALLYSRDWRWEHNHTGRVRVVPRTASSKP